MLEIILTLLGMGKCHHVLPNPVEGKRFHQHEPPVAQVVWRGFWMFWRGCSVRCTTCCWLAPGPLQAMEPSASFLYLWSCSTCWSTSWISAWFQGLSGAHLQIIFVISAVLTHLITWSAGQPTPSSWNFYNAYVSEAQKRGAGAPILPGLGLQPVLLSWGPLSCTCPPGVEGPRAQSLWPDTISPTFGFFQCPTKNTSNSSREVGVSFDSGPKPLSWSQGDGDPWQFGGCFAFYWGVGGQWLLHLIIRGLCYWRFSALNDGAKVMLLKFLCHSPPWTAYLRGQPGA